MGGARECGAVPRAGHNQQLCRLQDESGLVRDAVTRRARRPIQHRTPSRDWLQEYVHPDDQGKVLAAIQHSIRSKTIYELEHRGGRADGSLGWTLSGAVPVLDENGTVKEWFGAASDITIRKQDE